MALIMFVSILTLIPAGVLAYGIAVSKVSSKNIIVAVLIAVGGCTLISIIGSGYGIIAYNNDVSTTDIFDRIYELFGASSYEPSNIMEVAYAIGLFVGIVVFYDHFAGHKLSKAPTPLEVEMDKYNKDVADSVIDRKSAGKERGDK